VLKPSLSLLANSRPEIRGGSLRRKTDFPGRRIEHREHQARLVGSLARIRHSGRRRQRSGRSRQFGRRGGGELGCRKWGQFGLDAGGGSRRGFEFMVRRRWGWHTALTFGATCAGYRCALTPSRSDTRQAESLMFLLAVTGPSVVATTALTLAAAGLERFGPIAGGSARAGRINTHRAMLSGLTGPERRIGGERGGDDQKSRSSHWYSPRSTGNELLATANAKET